MQTAQPAISGLVGERGLSAISPKAGVRYRLVYIYELSGECRQATQKKMYSAAGNEWALVLGADFMGLRRPEHASKNHTLA